MIEEYLLLELFDHYKSIEPEVKIAEYSSLYANNNMEFTLWVSPFENTAIATLEHKELNTLIFDICLKKLAKITCKEGNVFFFKEHRPEKPILIIQVKPTLSLDCDL